MDGFDLRGLLEASAAVNFEGTVVLLSACRADLLFILIEPRINAQRMKQMTAFDLQKAMIAQANHAAIASRDSSMVNSIQRGIKFVENVLLGR